MPLLKMLSRSRLYAFENTLNYIHNEHKTKMDEQESIPVLHNIRAKADDKEKIIDAFIENEAYRPITENRIYCFHTIISMSEKDRSKCTPKVMKQIMDKYFELRGDVLGYGLAHFNTDSPHIHILESATRYRKNKSSSLRKSELAELKVEMEDYVTKELGLEHSFIEHGKGKAYLKEREENLIKHGGISIKEMVKRQVIESLKQAKSLSEFKELLHDHQLIHYERRSDGIPSGVISSSGKKYRFTTLGIEIEDYLDLNHNKDLEKENQLLDKLKKIREKKQQNLNRTR